MKRNLAGAVVVISGASSGIGRATAHAFAAHRARLVLAARGTEDLETVARECEARGGTALTVTADITEPATADRLAQQAVEHFGRIDVWIEDAAVLVAGRLEDHTVDDIRQLVETNVTGAALGARAAMRVFRTQGSGVLIMVSSLLGVTPSRVVPAYAMSKFAVRGLALSLRQAVVHDSDIHVCTVLPGPVDTPVYQRAANRTGLQLRAIPPATAPERVAATIVSCARRPRRQATTGFVAHWILASHRIAPRVTEWAVAQYSARAVVRPTAAPQTDGAVFTPGAASVHGGWRRGRLRRRIGNRLGTYLSR